MAIVAHNPWKICPEGPETTYLAQNDASATVVRNIEERYERSALNTAVAPSQPTVFNILYPSSV